MNVITMMPPQPFDDLKTLDMDLQELDLDELQQPWIIDDYAESTYGEALDLDNGIRVTIPIHYTQDATSIKSMTQAIGRLPNADEAIHLWIGGQHSMGHIIPALIELAAPEIIDTLHVATLTFSKDNALEWADLMDKGKIKRLTILTSQYFSKTSPQIYDFALALFQRRPVEVFPRRAHTKLMTAKLSDGRTISAEGSANTRSARTLEQVCIFGSPEVYDFHTAMMGKAKSSTKDRHLES
jgi:hypothetical protein